MEYCGDTTAIYCKKYKTGTSDYYVGIQSSCQLAGVTKFAKRKIRSKALKECTCVNIVQYHLKDNDMICLNKNYI